MIRQHLTTGVPSLTFHPWPWAESFSYWGQPSISTHQSHIYAAPFHSPQPFLAPTSITMLYPFTDIWENTNTLLASLVQKVNTHILSCSDVSSITWNVLWCCQVICRCTLEGCSLVTRLLRYQHLRWDMTWSWNPCAHWQLRPLHNRQPVVTDCGHEHPEDHLARKSLDQKSITSHTSAIFRVSCAGVCQHSDICNGLALFTVSFFYFNPFIFAP